MIRTSFRHGPKLGLVITTALLVLYWASSPANAAEPKASNVAKGLTCPEQQGQLKRLSAAIDGTSCTYGLDNDQTFQVNLLQVHSDQTSPARYRDMFSILEFGIEPKQVIETVVKFGINLEEEYSRPDSKGNVSDYRTALYPEPNNSGLIHLGLALKGPRLGPLFIGILVGKGHINETAIGDFVDLTETAAVPWVNPALPEPSRSPDRSKASHHHR